MIIYSEGFFVGLIDYDLYSISISPIFLQDLNLITNKTVNDIVIVKNKAELYKVIDNIQTKGYPFIIIKDQKDN